MFLSGWGLLNTFVLLWQASYRDSLISLRCLCFTVQERLRFLSRKIRWCDVDSCCILSINASAIKQASKKTLLPLCLPGSLYSVPRIALTYLCLYRIHIEPCPLPICMPSLPSWMRPSSMQHSIAGAAGEPLCSWDWHVAVGVGWLSHCHSLDVMRKSTLDLLLWSALLEDPGESRLRVQWEPPRVSRGRLIPGRPHTGLWPLSSSQTGAIKFSPHYLRQSHHRLALAGEGKGKKSRGGGWVTPQSVCMWVCHLLGRGGGEVHWWEKKKSGRSTIHQGTMFDTSTNKAQVTLRHFLGSLNRNGDLLFIGA